MRALLLTLLTGCSGMEPEGCRGADWYDLGFRDAIFGVQRQDDLYALQCEPHGFRVDAARYRQGWQEGRYEADHRTAGSQD